MNQTLFGASTKTVGTADATIGWLLEVTV